jgi:hypothetical protein
MKHIYSCFFVLTLFAIGVSGCSKQIDTTKPKMTLLDAQHVEFNNQKVKISSLVRTLKEYRMSLDPAVRDSIQIQFELYQGIDKEVLQRVKEEIKNAGINDLKFVAPFSK